MSKLQIFKVGDIAFEALNPAAAKNLAKQMMDKGLVPHGTPLVNALEEARPSLGGLKVIDTEPVKKFGRVIQPEAEQAAKVADEGIDPLTMKPIKRAAAIAGMPMVDASPMDALRGLGKAWQENIVDPTAAALKSKLTPDVQVGGQAFPTSSPVSNMILDTAADPLNYVPGGAGAMLGAGQAVSGFANGGLVQEPGIDIYDISGTEPVKGTIGHEEVVPAIQSGSFAFAQNAKIPVISPDGQMGTIDGSEFNAALEAGFQYATPQMRNEAKFGTAGQQLRTGIEGAVDMASFGLAGAASDRLGLSTPEERLARKEVNPVAYGAGQVGGLFTPIGAGAVAAKAGQAVIRGAQATTALGRIGSKAAAAAVENVVFSSSDEVAKRFMNDPNQTAESVIANLGLSAVVGGGFGATLGAVPEIWKLGPGKKVQGILEGLNKRSEGITGLDEVSAKPFVHMPATAEEFSNIISQVRQHPDPLYKANITPYTPEEYAQFRTFLAPDKKSGYAVKPDGELISVFSLAKGRGAGLVDDAVINNNAQKLDAFDINGKLPKLYGKYMDEVERLKFADEYAPADWNYDAIGRPDVVIMKLNPGKLPSSLNIPDEMKAALSNSPELKQMAAELFESGTTAGRKAQASLDNFKASVDDATAAAVGKNKAGVEALSDLSDHAAGVEIREAVQKQVERTYEPLRKRYKQMEDKFVQSPIAIETRQGLDEGLGQLIVNKGLLKAVDEEPLRLVQNTLSKLSSQATAQDLRLMAQNLADAHPHGKSTFKIAGDMVRLIKTAQDETTALAAHRIGPEVGAQFKALQSEYRQFKTQLEEMSSYLGIGRPPGAETFSKHLKGKLDGVDVINRLTKDRVELRELLAQHYPEAAAIAKRHELDVLLAKSRNKELTAIDVNKLAKNLEKLDPESRAAMLNSEQLQKLSQLKEVVDKIPKRLNPSGSAGTLDRLWRGIPASAGGMGALMMGGNPIMGALMGELARYMGREAPDAVKLAMLKYLGSGAPTNAAAFKAAVGLANSALKAEKATNKAVKAVIEGGALDLKKVSTDKLRKQVEQIEVNEGRLLEVGAEAGHYAPDTAAVISMSAVRNLRYLASLRPSTASLSPLDAPRKVAANEEAEYERALQIAENPLIILKGVQEGRLNPKDIQHLQQLSPAMAQSLRDKLLQQVMQTDGKIPYKTQLGLSAFLGQPLSSSMQPQAIQASQPIQQQTSMQPEGKPARKSSSLKSLSSSAQTQSQGSESRRSER